MWVYIVWVGEWWNEPIRMGVFSTASSALDCVCSLPLDFQEDAHIERVRVQ